MKLSATHFLAGVFLLGAPVLFYIKMNHVSVVEHKRFDDDLEQLRNLDVEVDKGILKARFHLLEDYDDFPRQIAEMKQATAAVLTDIPSFLPEKGRGILHQRAEGFSLLLTQKEGLLERFKSQNAVLKNSLRYLPFAGTELIKEIAADGQSHRLEAILNELMRQVLVYSLQTSDEHTQELRRSLQNLENWRSEHAGHPQNEPLASFVAHVHSILARKPKVEALMQQLAAVPTRQQVEEFAGSYDQQFAQALHAAESYRSALYGMCLLLVGGIGYTLYALSAANAGLDRRVRERTSAVSRKNEELQAEIAERKRAEAELERTNQQLLEMSRRAGMAEVATSVLHNVGNVLNSVNVSCSVIGDKVRKSRIASVARTAELLEENAHDLAAFFTSDPRGQKLPHFFDKLAVRLAEEQAAVLTELQSLDDNISHINEIVAVQQNYANVGGVCEFLSIAALVEDALRMNADAFARQGVAVIREFAELPPMSLDKHKVLQILVNLVNNARQALDARGAGQQLLVRIASGDGGVRVTVRDNGVGIPPENLTRIFAHGFTTRKDGHGFGLHSAALAAREMGGSLIAHSDGPGCGATFILEFPVSSPGMPQPHDYDYAAA